MSALPTEQQTNVATVAPHSPLGVEQIATFLNDSTGASVCYLTIVDPPYHTPQLLATSSHLHVFPSWDALDGAGLLRRALSTRAAQIRQFDEWHVLALPFARDEQMTGGVLLLYSSPTLMDVDRAGAAAKLAACALDSARQIAALHLQAEEIEERTRVREIQISRNLIRGVIDSIPMGLALLDGQGMVLAVNRTLSERFGYEPSRLVGRFYDATIGCWEDSPAAQTFMTGRPGKIRRTIVRPDSERALLEIASIPLLDAEGHPHQVVEVWEDITERVALQTQLIRVEKLAAIGQLAASIAHEVGNPLQAIQGFLSLFLEQCPPDIPNQRFLELAEGEIERIVQVLARLRDLYRSRADVIDRVDMNALIHNVLLLTSRQLERRRIRVVHELSPTLCHIRGVADQFKQVILNLVLNAAEAMVNGGVLRIQTSNRDESSVEQTVVIVISDTGTGISPDQLPYIFDGLHSTKEQGMGLGLYTSKAIVEQHMGRISVVSTLGKGTTFTIVLPLNAKGDTV